ncbi:MAG: sigma-54-dependent Fis family transcriptional regulator [Nitrospirae bacterium]|nr:sigma-54-dependent Fis family transcriptional regulator [Nitrospirota bacterium]
MQRKILLWSSSTQSAVESILKTAYPAFRKVRNEIELFRELDLNHAALIIIGDSIIRSGEWSEVFKKTRSLFPNLNYLLTATSDLIGPLEEEFRNSESIDFLKLPEETLLLEEKIRRSSQPKTVILEPELLVQSEMIKEDAQSSNDYGHLLSHSKKMKDVLNIINQVAETNITVLVRGESGTGKELVSRTVHARSLRREKPFVKVLCAALPEGLLESELFGYEKGAFTGAHRRKPGKFEFANNGTIFLDEIGEIHPILQAKLLQVLQDGEFSRIGGETDVKVDARVIAATNKQLEKAVEDGSFREDLFYRLNVVSIHLPPLRERKEEVPVLAEYFFNKYCEQYNKKKHPLSDQTLKLLQDYDWPGNIREMENTVKRMVVLENENIILQKINEKQVESIIPVPALPHPLIPAIQSADSETKPGFSLKEVGKDAAGKAEKELIQTILNQTHWNRKKAAQLLQISYKALLYKIKKYELNDVI